MSANKVNELFQQELKVINMGLQDFAQNLKERENTQVMHVDWSPPAGGDEELLDLLDKLS